MQTLLVSYMPAISMWVWAGRDASSVRLSYRLEPTFHEILARYNDRHSNEHEIFQTDVSRMTENKKGFLI